MVKGKHILPMNQPGKKKLRNALAYVLSRGICRVCARKVDWRDASFDHIIPRAWDGPSEVWNLWPTHPDCHKTLHRI